MLENHDRRSPVASSVSRTTRTHLLATVAVALLARDGFALGDKPLDAFFPGALYPMIQPLCVEAGDLNQDGLIDLAVGCDASPGVILLLNQGDATFTQSPLSTVSYLDDFLIDDLNLDGFPDLLVITGQTDMQLLVGMGDGTFAAPLSLPNASIVGELAVADLNQDGWPDVVVRSALDVHVMLGTAPAAFLPPTLVYASTSYVGLLDIADIDADGELDLAFVEWSTDSAQLLFGVGDGTFSAPTSYGVGSHPTSVVVDDLNADGLMDLIVSNRDSNEVSVQLGLGAGLLGPAQFFPTTIPPSSVRLGDVDLDGNLDVVACGFSRVEVLRGLGNGQLAASEPYFAGYYPSCVTLADLDLDGTLDLAIGNIFSVSVLENIGDGTFEQPDVYPSATAVTALAAADFDGDGYEDLVLSNASAGIVSVLPGHPSGQLGAPTSYMTGAGPSDVVVADMSLDGHLDLVISNYGDGTYSILNGGGDGTFDTATTTFLGPNPLRVEVAHLNQDEWPDLVLGVGYFGPVMTRLADGKGGFTPGPSLPAASMLSDLEVADFDQDGFTDILVLREWTTGNFFIYFGEPSGQYHQSIQLTASTEPSASVLGDFNRDGNVDIAVANRQGPSVSVILADGPGTFAPQVEYFLGSTNSFSLEPAEIAADDVNLDGWLDLVVGTWDGNSVQVLLGVGDGLFGPPTGFGVGGFVSAVTTADLNGDLYPDLAVSSYSAVQTTVLINRQTAPPTVTYCTPKLSSDGCLATISATGLPCLGAGGAPFLVNADNASTNKNGLLFFGLDSAAIPLQGGWLCVQPPLGRTTLQSSGTNGIPCSGALSFDFGAFLDTTPPPFLNPGDSVFAQYWIRDPGDPFGVVRTDGVTFVLAP